MLKSAVGGWDAPSHFDTKRNEFYIIYQRHFEDWIVLGRFSMLAQGVSTFPKSYLIHNQFNFHLISILKAAVSSWDAPSHFDIEIDEFYIIYRRHFEGWIV